MYASYKIRNRTIYFPILLLMTKNDLSNLMLHMTYLTNVLNIKISLSGNRSPYYSVLIISRPYLNQTWLGSFEQNFFNPKALPTFPVQIRLYLLFPEENERVASLTLYLNNYAKNQLIRLLVRGIGIPKISRAVLWK